MKTNANAKPTNPAGRVIGFDAHLDTFTAALLQGPTPAAAGLEKLFNQVPMGPLHETEHFAHGRQGFVGLGQRMQQVLPQQLNPDVSEQIASQVARAGSWTSGFCFSVMLALMIMMSGGSFFSLNQVSCLWAWIKRDILRFETQKN